MYKARYFKKGWGARPLVEEDVLEPREWHPVDEVDVILVHEDPRGHRVCSEHFGARRDTSSWPLRLRLGQDCSPESLSHPAPEVDT